MLNSKGILYTLLLVLVIITQSCLKCRDIEKCHLPETGERYFGNYKPGNYWVYYNQDMTKKDSVYVIDYKVTREKYSKHPCIEFDKIEARLQSDFIFDQNSNSLDFNKKYNYSSSNGGGCNKRGYLFITNYFKTNIYSSFDIDTLSSSGSYNQIKRVGSLEIISQRYDNVVLYQDYLWLTPKVGVIQYINENKTDTFYLHETNIQ